jgi:hypothetical protein
MSIGQSIFQRSLEKLYVVCFHESEEYHIHIHLITEAKPGGRPTEYGLEKFKRTNTEPFSRI